MKRPNPSNDEGGQSAPKRRRTHQHLLRHKQPYHVDPILAPQDEAFFKSQMMRAIALNLQAVGFDSIKPTALEAFRAEVEEYMLKFLAQVKQSMNACRRNDTIPQDFIYALAQQGLKPSSLLPHLDLQSPNVTQPPIPAPPPQEPPPPDFEGLLGPELSGAKEKEARKYIPKHFPNFPSKHTWQSTPVYTEREQDPRKIRERATEEGILAEQALRKLMAASKSGVQNKGKGKQKQSQKRRKSEELWDVAMESLQQSEEERKRRTQGSGLGEWERDSASPERRRKPQQENRAESMLVNYERRYWRKAAQSAAWGS